MTKEEFEAQKAEIIALHGKPEFDNYAPTNESARLMNALKLAYRMACAQNKRIHNQKLNKEGLKEIGESLTAEQKANAEMVTIPQIFLDKTSLQSFTEKEIKVIEARLNNDKLTNKQIAIMCCVSTQFVTGLLGSRRYLITFNRIIHSLLEPETALALLRLAKGNDSKVVLRLAEHYEIIKSEKKDINLTNTPIEDPKAIQLLKELGDSLAQDSNDPPLGPIPK